MTTNISVDAIPTGFDSAGLASGTIDLEPGVTDTFTFDLIIFDASVVADTFLGDDGIYSVDDGGFSGSDPTGLDTATGEFSYSLTLSDWVAAGSPATIVLNFATTYVPNDMGPSPTGSFTINVTCFARGTAIATPSGETAIESLQIGDLIRTADGREVPAKWIGRQTVSTVFAENTERLRLVDISAGALGDASPARALRVTADHAMFLDGLLINAGALVNGTTITYQSKADLGASYKIFHIETEDHDIILAEGAPTETYIDYVARGSFDNYGEYVALYGEAQPVAELPYPRISAARLLPAALKARFSETHAA